MSCHKKKRKQTIQHVPGNWELWTPCAGGFALKNLPKISDCKVDQKKDQHILNIYWYWLPTMQSKFDIYIIFVFKIKFLILLTFASCNAFFIKCYKFTAKVGNVIFAAQVLLFNQKFLSKWRLETKSVASVGKYGSHCNDKMFMAECIGAIFIGLTGYYPVDNWVGWVSSVSDYMYWISPFGWIYWKRMDYPLRMDKDDREAEVVMLLVPYPC